jgi:hypothetical protein
VDGFIVEADLSPFEVSDLRIPGAGIEQKNHEIVDIPHLPDERGAPEITPNYCCAIAISSSFFRNRLGLT